MSYLFNTFCRVAAVACLSTGVMLGFTVSVSAAPYGIPEVAGSEFEEVQPPSNVRVVYSSTGSITVAWNSDVRSIIDDFDQTTTQTQYTVRVYAKKSGERVKTVETDAMEVTVTGLERNKGYVVRVWAERNGYVSEYSEIVARTSPAAPNVLTASIVRRQIFYDVLTNEPVNQFGGSAMSKFLAYLSWEAPKGTVRYYTVNVYKKGSDEPLKTIETKKLFVAVGGLKLGKKYQYTVTSHFNDDYASEVSERVKFKVSREAVE